jgi:hypothetical protein
MSAGPAYSLPYMGSALYSSGAVSSGSYYWLPYTPVGQVSSAGPIGGDSGLIRSSSGRSEGRVAYMADYGRLGVYAYAAASLAEPAAFGAIYAAFHDTWIVQPPNPAMLGAFGTLEITMSVSGSWYGNGNPDIPTDNRANAMLSFVENVSDDITRHRDTWWRLAGSPDVNGDGSVSGSRTWSIPFAFGYPFYVGFKLGAGAMGCCSSGAWIPSAEVDFLHTAEWSGFGVFDSRGMPVSDYALITASGHDYRSAGAPGGPGSSPVPEPSTVILLAAGLAAVVLRGTRRAG